MKKKPIIAIDGYSSTGKSSISKAIANKLGLIHIDTGALYRGVTYYGLQNYLEGNRINLTHLINHLDDINLEFILENNSLVLYLNGKDISEEIRSTEVSENVSLVAQQKEVREFLLESQRKTAKNGGVIMDGRDIGTFVLPNADYKFFMVADIDVRTERRFTELQQMGVDTSREEVKENLLLRDQLDTEREISPLRKDPEAIVIDNTAINREETLNLILSYL